MHGTRRHITLDVYGFEASNFFEIFFPIFIVNNLRNNTELLSFIVRFS